jgi:hypothetical protein
MGCETMIIQKQQLRLPKFDASTLQQLEALGLIVPRGWSKSLLER